MAQGQEAAGGHVGHGQQGNGDVLGVAVADGDLAQTVAGGDGRQRRFVIQCDGAGQGLHVQILGEHGLGALRRVDGHGGHLLAQGDGHLLHQLVLVQHLPGGEVVKAPVEQARRLGEAFHDVAGAVLLFHLFRAQHHADKRPAAADGGGDKALAGGIGAAGLDALGAGVQIARQTPVGDQGVGAVEHALLLGLVGGRYLIGLGVDDGHEILKGHGLPGDEIQVVGAGVVAGLGQAGGVGEVGVLAAQLLRPLVHALHEGVHGAGHRLAQDIARLVGGDDQHTVQQLLHRQRFTFHDVGGAAVLRQAAQGAGGGGDGLIHPQLAALDGLEYQQGGHDLGGAGDGQLVVGVLVIEYGARLGLHQQGGLGAYVRILQRGGGNGEKTAQQGGQQKNREQTAYFHVTFSPCML